MPTLEFPLLFFAAQFPMIGPFFQSFFGRKKSVIRYMTTTATKTTSAYLTSTTDSSSQHSLWLYVTSVTGHHHAAPPRLAREVSVRELSINSSAGGEVRDKLFVLDTGGSRSQITPR